MTAEPWRTPVDKETLLQVAAAIDELIEAHMDHPWHIVGRCVYCGPCGLRLYAGRIPEDHPIYRPPPSRSKTAARTMRERWNKDA